ncbi:ATP-binding protein [Roseomonas elaeocarpi]|uniref:ATP-binding protein n=1 Tax=Roseomonas elaeocarpi TaxID=907779 RepID=A0ABV6JRT6_9PROT
MESLPILDQSQVAAARRQAAALAKRVGFGEEDAGRVALVASELAGNILRHAIPRDAGPRHAPGGTGEILLGTVEEDGIEAVEMIALDRGRGMDNISACLEDGFSTAGTPGTGLGAVRRQSDLFDIHSTPGQGTAVLARLRRDRGTVPPAPLRHGTVSLPKPGEEVCGDGWALRTEGEHWLLLVADGLGHGPQAAEASLEAVRRFRQADPAEDLASVLRRLHDGLRHTRGAAVSVARGALPFGETPGQVTYGGVGNVAGLILDGHKPRHMVSHNGTLGHTASRFQATPYPCPRDALVVLHSDGIATSWKLDHLPGITRRHPTLIAGVIYRDAARGRDDATVAVLAPGRAEMPA